MSVASCRLCMPCAGQVARCVLQAATLSVASCLFCPRCLLHDIYCASCMLPVAPFTLLLCVACFTVLLHVACRMLCGARCVLQVAGCNAVRCILHVVHALCCCFVCGLLSVCFLGCTFRLVAAFSLHGVRCMLHVARGCCTLQPSSCTVHAVGRTLHIYIVLACFRGVLHVARLVRCVLF
jgi:hypothetical protein